MPPVLYSRNMQACKTCKMQAFQNSFRCNKMINACAVRKYTFHFLFSDQKYTIVMVNSHISYISHGTCPTTHSRIVISASETMIDSVVFSSKFSNKADDKFFGIAFWKGVKKYTSLISWKRLVVMLFSWQVCISHSLMAWSKYVQDKTQDLNYKNLLLLLEVTCNYQGRFNRYRILYVVLNSFCK